MKRLKVETDDLAFAMETSNEIEVSRGYTKFS